jgi:mevalonate kinase
MAFECRYSVPSKVILFGEHCILYGHPAISVAISNRLVVKASYRPTPNVTQVQIEYNGTVFSFDPSSSEPPDAAPLTQLYWAAFHSVVTPNHTLECHFAYPFEATGGLGSSAAVSVLMAVLAARVANKPLDREELFQKGKSFEGFFHANSSGLDVFTVLHGSGVKSTSGQFEHFAVPPFPLLIVDSGVNRQTRKAVEHVRSLVDTGRPEYPVILSDLGKLSNDFCECPDGDKEAFVVDGFRKAEELLERLDLACPEILEIVEIARANGLSAKLSGAGLGGIVLVAGQNLFEKEALFDRFQHARVVLDETGLKEEPL